MDVCTQEEQAGFTVWTAHFDDLGDSGASSATETIPGSLGAGIFLMIDCSQFLTAQ